MRNEIEKYIDKNRSQLDVDMPGDALWNKIEEELDDKKKRRGVYWWWGVAASVVIGIGVLFQLPKNVDGGKNVSENVNAIQKLGLDTIADTVQINLTMVPKGKLKTTTTVTAFSPMGDEVHYKNKSTYSLDDCKANAFGATTSQFATVQSNVKLSPLGFTTASTSISGEYTVAKKDTKNETVMSGILSMEGNDLAVPKGAQIVVTDNESGEIVGIYKPNAKTGKYLFVLPPGKDYNVTYEAEGLLFKSESLIVPNDQLIPEKQDAEIYGQIVENNWKSPMQEPLSTFSVDVDAAGYSNVRRFLNNDELPPMNAVKIEEMVNYFGYNYPAPSGDHPLSITTEYAACPWNTKHQLVHIGLKAKDIQKQNIPASNLVFLIDVSGSMQAADKLELLKKGFSLLTQQLREQDKVSMVVYAGASGIVLPPTRGNDKETILAALDKLAAGGSTAGAEGIELAYKVAEENFMKNGNNRVILATDGDFNVGISEDDALVELIEEKRKSGVFLTVLGFGEGNLQAEKMEKLADNGNGNYAYVDNLMEAKKVLVNEFGALYTVAKDVKLQVEFNPAKVKAYRLLGYENRMLNTQDFDNDTIDAGEMGAGHTVTALYEIIPANSDEKIFDTPELRYQKTEAAQFASNNELMYIKFRYKDPNGTQSKLLKHVVLDQQNILTENFYFSAAVAEFGLLLRDSKFKGNASFENIESNAVKGYGSDANGYRHEFVMLVRKAKLLKK